MDLQIDEDSGGEGSSVSSRGLAWLVGSSSSSGRHRWIFLDLETTHKVDDKRGTTRQKQPELNL